ncbi:hypothetical protein COO60DRAFT_1518758 [Scenedesmus sp. NREL 46B-D3]|nr:hypothetical protein COO60DRAFT_1518758 [Scenedesmus sp. NREL 46B-D3]
MFVQPANACAWHGWGKMCTHHRVRRRPCSHGALHVVLPALLHTAMAIVPTLDFVLCKVFGGWCQNLVPILQRKLMLLRFAPGMCVCRL